MPKYGYLVVEGPHDVELIYRLLSPFGLKRVQFEFNLDGFFAPLIPRTFPPDGDLQKRMPIPLFLQSDTHCVAVHSAIGDTRLVQTIEENSTLVPLPALTGVGILLDADTTIPPADRYVAVREALRAKQFAFPDDPGMVSATPPRLGAFLLPDNLTQGTLEDLLLECAQHQYPNLLASASVHVDAAVADTTLLEDDKKEINKPAGRSKAVVGSIASVLRPGRALQVSLQDNRWLRDTALTLPRIKAVQDFLVALLDLS